jgi:translocation protein SEC63
MLEYDNSAFYYFALTLLSFYVAPAMWYVGGELWAAFGPQSAAAVATSTLQVEAAKAEALRKKNRGVARLKKWQFVLNAVLLTGALASCTYLGAQVYMNGKVQQFDPYAILKIEPGAAVKEIQKSYRKLSLQFHPDKNPGDKAAEEMFMKVAKAYEALTDENARKNFEEFGNPDGKQALEVSIGLPTALLENPKVVLVVYLLAMVIVIPVAVGLWYAQSKQYGEKNIKYETYTAFYQFLSENHRIKMLPEVLAASAEFRELSAPKASDRECLNKLLGKLKADKLMQKPKFEHPVLLKGNLLLHAHVLRLSDAYLSEDLRADLDAMLTISPELIEGMAEISQQRRWLQTTLSILRFSQCLVQALWVNDHSLQTLPFFTENEVKHVTRGAKVQARTLAEYVRVPDSEKKGLASFTDAQREEILQSCALLPRIKVETRVFVEEEENEGEGEASDATSRIKGEDVFEGDIITIRVTVTRENVAEGEVAPPVFAPRFPRVLRERWWVILSDRPRPDPRRPTAEPPQATIFAMEKLTGQGRVVTHDLRLEAPPTAGSYSMDLHLVSDCYMGYDEEIEVKFDVRPATELPAYAPHPEDLELDNEPTLFEQMLTSNIDEDSSDEEDEGAAQTAAAASSSTATKSPRRSRRDDDGDASDSEGETD